MVVRAPGMRKRWYEFEFFERCLHEAFDVRQSERLGSGTRVLYFATPKSG